MEFEVFIWTRDNHHDFFQFSVAEIVRMSPTLSLKVASVNVGQSSVWNISINCSDILMWLFVLVLQFYYKIASRPTPVCASPYGSRGKQTGQFHSDFNVSETSEPRFSVSAFRRTDKSPVNIGFSSSYLSWQQRKFHSQAIYNLIALYVVDYRKQVSLMIQKRQVKNKIYTEFICCIWHIQ
jgi:hypothetical protein